MKQQSLKEELRQFATQQDALFGAIVQGKKTEGARGATATQESQNLTLPTDAAGSRFEQHLALVNEEWVKAQSLDVMKQMISGCQKCPLGKTRNKLVFGTGNPHADIVVIGEAPGAERITDASRSPSLAAKRCQRVRHVGSTTTRSHIATSRVSARSTAAGSSEGARASTLESACASSESGRVVRNAPRGALPTGARTGATM